MSHQESDHVIKFVWGLVSGVLLSFLFIRFGFELPGAIGLEQKLISGAISKTAELEVANPKLDPLSRRRALAVILANQPDTFLEIDNAIGNQFFNEYLRRKHPNQTLLLPSFTLQKNGYSIPQSKVGVPQQPDSLAAQLRKNGSLMIGDKQSLFDDGQNNIINQNGIIRQDEEKKLKEQFPDAPQEVIAYFLKNRDLSRQLRSR